MIEDACHAVGSSYFDIQGRSPHGKMIGSLGDIACFSFFSNKNLAIGEGGMVVTNRDDLAERLRLLRSHGMTTLTWERHQGYASFYDVVLHGYNYRMDEIRASLGRVQLKKLEKNNFRRQRLVELYRSHLDILSDWHIPFAKYSGSSAYHLMAVVAPNMTTRSHVVNQLKAAKIQTSLHYPCVPDFQSFKKFSIDDLKRSRSFSKRVITLPLFPTMTECQVEEICSVIHQSLCLGNFK